MNRTVPVTRPTYFRLLLILLALVIAPSISFAAPLTSNFQAHITKPDGQPMQDASVTFTFSYRDPSNSCTLYVEEFPNVSMASSNGDISLKLGAGNRTHPASGSLTYFSMFSNTGSNIMSCFEGGNFTPTLMTQNRKLIVQFTSVNGPQILGGLDIESVPYALYANEADNAQKLGGFAASLYAKFSDVTTCTGGNLLQFNGSVFSCVSPGTPASFSGNLSGDVTGTQGATVVSALRGIPLVGTAPTTNQVLKFNGTSWVPTTVAFGGGSVTNVTSINPYLTVINGSTTPQLAVNVGTVAGSVAAGDDSRITGSFQTITTLGGDLSGTLPNPTIVKVGSKTAAQIVASVNDTSNATNLNTASTIVKRDGSGNIAVGSISSVNNSTQNIYIYDSTNARNTQIVRPTAGSNYILTLPQNLGANGQVLTTDAAGVLSWSSPLSGTVTNVTGTAPISVATGTSTPVISMTAATGTVDGYLTSANFTTFNNKVSSQWTSAVGGIEYISGFVGIGTSGVPAAKLEISGTSGTTLKVVDGNQAAGKVLMSDAVGQASWATAPGGFQGSVNVTSTPYTITNLQNGKIFTYAGAGAGTLNLPAISGISDGFQITIVRDVPLAVTIVTNGADTFTNNVSTLEILGQNIQSITLTKIGTKWRYSNRANDCEIGKACWGSNHLYIGTMNGKQYFTTPGGCTNSATPTCAGGPDTTNVSWASNAGGNPAYNITTGINNFYEGKADSATLASTYTDTVAAKYCENMTYAGYSDWYLPARGEFLYLIYEHAGDIPGLTQNSYWVTTEYSAADAWSYYGFGTYMTSGSKATLMRVRCIRNF